MGKCKVCGVISRPDDSMCRRCGLVGEFQRERDRRADVMLSEIVHCNYTGASESRKKTAWYCNHCQTVIQVAICLDISIAASHLRICPSASGVDLSNFKKIETGRGTTRKLEDRVRKVFSIVHRKKQELKAYNEDMFNGL